MSTLMYDPPSGWMYGFPKPYKPKEGESLIETLRRDGYPEHELKQLIREDGTVRGCRFFGSKKE